VSVVLLFGILVFVFLRLPIAFALVAAAALVIAFDAPGSLAVVPLRLFHGADSFPLVAVPLFVLAGALMNRFGISQRLVEFASSLVGFVRGGLAMTTTVASMFFSEVSGSAVADAAALGSVLVPAMTRRGYPKAFAAAVLSASASIAILIPPSVPMILYGSITETSITRLFLAGVVPGVLTGVAIMITSWILARRGGFAEREPFRLARVGTTFRRALAPLLLPVIILGGILGGVFTATEAAGLAVVAALAIGFSSGFRSLKDLRSVFLESAHQTGAVMILVAASAVVGWYLTVEQVPQALAELVTSNVSGKTASILLLNGALLIAGMFLHSTAAIVLLVPIFMPLATAVGIDPVQFGLIVSVNLAIGQQTPPVASVLIISCSIAGSPMDEVFRVSLYFIASMLVVLLLVSFAPSVSLWLPDLVLGS
jgi:tripartite ATP-independent transporter DctM subunit